MYCNHCGTPIPADQLVCTTCGRSQLDARASIVARSRVGEHLHLLSIFWFVVGGFLLLCAGVMWTLAALARITTGGNPMTHVAGPVFFWRTVRFLSAPCSGQSGHRLGLAASSPLGTHAGSGHGIHRPAASAVRDRAGHLHALCAIAQRCRRGIRPHGRRRRAAAASRNRVEKLGTGFALLDKEFLQDLRAARR